jgi:hypothetical protein
MGVSAEGKKEKKIRKKLRLRKTSHFLLGMRH